MKKRNIKPLILSKETLAHLDRTVQSVKGGMVPNDPSYPGTGDNCDLSLFMKCTGC
jgi:hypothetical protein